MDDCNFCSTCLVGGPPSARPPSPPPSDNPENRNTQLWRRRRLQAQAAPSDPTGSHLGGADPSSAVHSSALQSRPCQYRSGARDERQSCQEPGVLIEKPSGHRHLSQLSYSFYETQNDTEYLNPAVYLPSREEVLQKQSLPNCTVCYGCNTNLSPLRPTSSFLGTCRAFLLFLYPS